MSNSQYLTIYLNNAEAFVYTIQGYYLIQYKMQLPKYGPMLNTTFSYFKNQMNDQFDLIKITKDSYTLIMVENMNNEY